MDVRRAELPGSDHSDDRTIVGSNFVIMLDGASAFRPVPVPASAYVDRLGSRLVEWLDRSPQADLREVLRHAIDDTAAALDLHLHAGSAPSSTVTIFRCGAGQADALVLGDNLLAVPGETIVDRRLDTVASDLRRAYRDRLARGTGYDQDHHRILQHLQEHQAASRNRTHGYWIAEADPTAAVHAIVRHWDPAPGWAVLATDGAYEPLAHLGIDDWSAVAAANSDTLASLLRRCHLWESETDPLAVQLPRAKVHDDKSLAVVEPGDSR